MITIVSWLITIIAPLSAVCYLYNQCQLFVYICNTKVSCLFTFVIQMSAVCLPFQKLTMLWNETFLRDFNLIAIEMRHFSLFLNTVSLWKEKRKDQKVRCPWVLFWDWVLTSFLTSCCLIYSRDYRSLQRQNQAAFMSSEFLQFLIVYLFCLLCRSFSDMPLLFSNTWKVYYSNSVTTWRSIIHFEMA